MLGNHSSAVRRGYCAVAAVLLFQGMVEAHVDLDSPHGGSLNGGFTFPIEWHTAIEHNTLDWDLWYSTAGPTGPWIEIVSNLPKGDASVGVPHVYNWNVPNEDISNAWVRVRQDNGGTDYFDVSSGSFLIDAAMTGDFTGNNTVDASDLLVWKNGFGISSGALFTNGDADSDGDVDGADFLLWQANFSGPGGSAVLAAVPEPSSLFLLLLSTAGLMIRRR